MVRRPWQSCLSDHAIVAVQLACSNEAELNLNTGLNLLVKNCFERGMELRRHQSALTETSKRALATNKGQSETLKSTFGTLESDLKAKCDIVNAQQARFVRMIKTKLPAIKVAYNHEAGSTRRQFSPFSTPPISPPLERKTSGLPSLNQGHKPLARRRSKSFSDLVQAVKEQEKLAPERMTRRKSAEHLQENEGGNEQRMSIGNRPRSHSNIDLPWDFCAAKQGEDGDKCLDISLPRRQKSDEHIRLMEGENEHRKLVGNRPRSFSNLEQSWNFKADKQEQESKKRYLSLPVRKQSAPISPALTLKSHTYAHAETRELTNKKSLSKQLEDVKDLRYLRSGKYSSETMDMNSNMNNDSPEW